MKSFSDSEVLANMKQKYEDARTAQKEGAGTHRNAGDSGRIAAEWIMWRQEARKRELLSTTPAVVLDKLK